MKKTILLFTFFALCFNAFCQLNKSITVYKNGVKTYESMISEYDKIDFNEVDTVTDVDGNTYRTIIIGNKQWMVDNLRTTKLNNGTPIANVGTANIKFANGVSGVLRTIPAYSWHNNLSYNKFIFGGLYNWYALSTNKLAPVGWRVATKEDWADMENYLAANGYNYDGTKSTDGSVGKILKSMCSEFYWISSTVKGSVGFDVYANNKSGLSLTPGSYQDGASWAVVGSKAAYWTLSAHDSLQSISRLFSVADTGVIQTRTDVKQLAYSVRCVRDVVVAPVAGLLTDAALLTVRNGFETRRTTALNALLTTPLKEAPIDAGYTTGSGVPMSITKSYSLSSYAFKCLWLNIKQDSANIALMRNADYYLTNPASYFADGDNFYWSADIWLKALELYGSKGTVAAGRITPTTETRLYELMYAYMNHFSTKGMFSPTNYMEYQLSDTWNVYGSENHHAQQFYTFWHFSKLLKDNATYTTKTFANGSVPNQFYLGMTDYIKRWLSERAKKGLVEMACDDYNLMTLKGVYNMYDFAPDAELSELSGKFLDLYWASWAQEQLTGTRGGGKARIYPGNVSNGWEQPLRELAYYYLNIGATSTVENEKFTVLTSKYRLPLVVMDMALGKREMGNFENTERAPGLALGGYNGPPFYKLRQDYGGIVRYSYCTPDFIMGSMFVEARVNTDWTMISSQNRWQGVVFPDNPAYRIFTYASDERLSYNSCWNVQSKGCLISAPFLSTYGKFTDSMRVYVSPWGLSGRIERSGWTFLESAGAYVAIKCVTGNFISRSSGRYLVCSTPSSPVIIEMAQKTSFASYASFQDKILALALSYDGKVVTHKTIYNDELKLYTDKTSMPKVNGSVIDLKPSYLLDSPFIKSIFNSGVIEINKNKRKLLLDFTLK